MSDVAPLPAAARVVVVGGGVGGASIAYHLARLGWREIVVIEQHELTEGTTWHSAGFVGQLRSTIGQTRMIMYSSGLYAELQEQTGRDPGWRGVGSLRVACTPERVQELDRLAGSAQTFGLTMDVITAAEAHDRLPLMNVDDVLAAAWLPGDGWLDPALLAQALAAGARAQGVAIHTGTRVTGFDVAMGGSPPSTPIGARSPPRSWSMPGAPPGGPGQAGRDVDPDRADAPPVRGHRAV